MVRIVSIHCVPGDERTGDMYGWGMMNPNIGESNKVATEADSKERIASRLRRRKLKETNSQGRERGPDV